MWVRNHAADIQRLCTPNPGKAYAQNRATGFLNHTPNTSRLDLTACVCEARVYARIGRLLLIVISVSLITMPLTERIWTWDHFLHGGQDFEFTALAILTTLCLALVLAQHCKQSVDLLLAARHLFSLICHDCVLAKTTRSDAISTFRNERVSSPVLGMYLLPLQI